MIVSIEQHVDWIAQCISDVTLNGTIEPSEDAEEKWVAHCNEMAEGTMANDPSCSSWYLGANVAGKPRIFMPYIGGVGPYREICDKVMQEGYSGFLISK